MAWKRGMVDRCDDERCEAKPQQCVLSVEHLSDRGKRLSKFELLNVTACRTRQYSFALSAL